MTLRCTGVITDEELLLISMGRQGCERKLLCQILEWKIKAGAFFAI